KTTVEIGTPTLAVCWRGLVKPAQMRPPKARLLWTGYIVGRVRNGMMQAGGSDPTRGVAGTGEDGPKNQNLFGEPGPLTNAVRQQAVVTHSRPLAAQTCKEQRQPEYFQAGNRKQDDPYNAQNVHQDKIDEHAFFASNRFPEGPIPWLRHRDCAVSHFRS